MKKIVVALFAIVLNVSEVKSQSYKDTLDNQLKKLYQKKYLPGFAVAIVNENGVVYQNSFGFADIENKQPYTVKTVQSIASVSKTMIAFAIGKLIQQGKLTFDTSINDILPYKVCHSKFPNVEIKIKDLVSHTSGLTDTKNNYDVRGRYFVKETKIDTSKLDQGDVLFINKFIAKNNKRSLQEHFHNVFSENGIWKNDNTWINYKPGTYYEYSNLGANLAAYLVELIAQQPYDEFVNKHILHPLKMNDSKWQQNLVNPQYLAKSYRTSDMISSPIFGENLYADGNIHSNVKNLSTYLIEVIKGYNGKSDLLDTEIYQQLFESQLQPEVAVTNPTKKFKNIGVFWMLAKDGSIYHNGGNPLGGTTYLRFDPDKNLGFILMCNYEIDTRASQSEFINTWKNLLKYATKLKP